MHRKIDLNTATQEELAELEGIGMGLAARIIDYRKTVGPFRIVAELAAVVGITDQMVRRFEDDVTVGSHDDEGELLPFVVDVQLQNADGDPYTGHRVIAHFFQRERLAVSADDTTEIVLCEVEVSAELSDEGLAVLTFPNLENLHGDVRFRFLAPDGEVLEVNIVSVENLAQQMAFDVDPTTFFDIERNEDPGFGKPGKIRGRVIDASGRVRIKNKQVLILGASVDNPGDADFRALIVAQTDDTGYFSGAYPVGVFTAGFGTVAIGEGVDIPIHLEEDGTFPGMVLLVVDEVPEDAVTEDDCDCKDGSIVPRLPDSEDLALAEGTYSDDIGARRCVDFTKPNRVLEEFSFSYVLRTTEPEIKGLTLEEPDKITFGQIAALFPSEVLTKAIAASAVPATVTRVRAAATGRVIDASARGGVSSNGEGSEPSSKPQILTQRIDAKLLKTLVKDPDGFTLTRLAQAANLTAHEDLVRGINKVLKCAPARTRLNCKKPVDWDDEPIIYQACTIAHGHLLRFKQEWLPDGYGMGDLLLSLPLAPAQKKQIAIIGWERSESSARTEAIIEREQLAATLSRDRDINEIINATLSERVRGGSKARTGAFGGGLGIAAIIPPIGGLLGIGGGTSKASSTAWQNSSRQTTASTLQQLRDRTAQAASALRSQRSTVVETTRQGERVRTETESVANYNHCHAITIQYFEVLRHLLARQRLVDVQECLFVPLLMTRFNRDKALRWRDSLRRAVLNRSLRRGFAAMERIENNYEGSDLPTGSYADEPLEHLDGYLYLRFKLARPRDDDDGFNAGAWSWIGRLMPWRDPQEFHENFLEDQQFKDRVFLEQLGGTIAENFVQLLRLFAVDSNDTETELPIDPTLVADFRNNRRLYISLRLSGELPTLARKDIKYIKISYQAPSADDLSEFLPTNSKVIVESGRMSYRTRFSSDFLFRDARIANDLTGTDDVRIFTPLNRREQRRPREEDKELSRQLLDHLNENLERFHHAVWGQMSDDRRYMLLDGFEAPNSGGRSVASVVENELVGIVGNSLILPVARGFHLDPTFNQDVEDPINLLDHYQPNTPIEPIRIALPTKGVYAEAVMGACNSCEHMEEDRFWRWEESPIPDSPTAIQPVSTVSRRAEPPDLEAKDFPAPIVAMQQAPAAPDPTGLSAALQLLGKPDLFRDITGLTENQRNALAALQSAVGTAQFFGGKAADLALQGNMRRDIDNALGKINQQHQAGAISDEQRAELTESALRSMIGGGTESPSSNSLTKEPEVEAAIRKASATPGGEINITRTTDNSAETIGTRTPPIEDVGRPFIIENADLTSERRAFNPSTRDKEGAMGTTSFSVRVPRLPKGGSIRWSVPPAAAGHYTLAGGAGFQTGNRVDITALRPGTTEIDVDALDADGVKLDESIKFPLSIPQFVSVDTGDATFIPLLKSFNLIDYEIEQVVTVAKETCDTILSTANVRTVWRMAPFSKTLPAQFAAGGAAAANVTTATFQGDPPSHALYGITNGGGVGPVIFNEIIDVFAGAFDDTVAGNTNEEVDEVTNEVINVMIADGLTSSAEKDLAIQILGRLLGETLSHEIIHSLIGSTLTDGFHNARPGLPDDLMNHGIDRSFQNRSGVVLTGPVGSDDLTNLLVIRDIFFINRPTWDGDAQAQLNRTFPVPPWFN